MHVVRSEVFDEDSWSAIAAASSGDRLYLAWAARDAEIRLASTPDGFTFSTPEHLPFRSEGKVDDLSLKSRWGGHGHLAPMRPGLAATAHGVDLAVATYDRRGRIRLLRFTPGGAWQEIGTSQRTAQATALAAVGNELVLAWTGSDVHLNLATTCGPRVNDALRLEHTSLLGPALSGCGTTVALAWTGTDLHVNLALGDADGRLRSHWRLDETSYEGPAVCALGATTAIAWTGTDDHLNVAVVDGDGDVRSQLRLDERSNYEPGLVRHGGSLFLVWTGLRSHIGVAQLGGASPDVRRR